MRIADCDEPFAQFPQLPDHAAVDQLVADARDDAADDVGVDDGANLDLLAEHGPESLAHQRQFLRAERHGRRHLADRDPLPFQHPIVERSVELRESADPAALDQQTDQIPHQWLTSRAENLIGHRALLAGRNLGAIEDGCDLRILKRPGQGTEIALPGIERPLLVGHLEDRLRVAPDRRSTWHATPPSVDE